MKRRFQKQIGLWLVVLALAGTGERAGAELMFQRPAYQEPEWLTMRISEVSAGIYAEGRYDQTTYKNSQTSVSHDFLFIGPSFGLNLNGSIYHPNLLQFNINSEGALGWGQDNITSPTATVHRNELQYLGWFAGSAELLAGKPFHGNIFGGYNHSFRDYDFFNTVTVDSWRYGGRLDYDIGQWNLHADYTHYDEDISSLNGPSTRHEDIAAFSARQERASGGTRLSYTFDEYTQVDLGRIGTGSDHVISLGDSERFGSQDQYRLNTSASYAIRDTFPEGNDELVADANLTADHSLNLSSAYDINYDRYTSGNFEANNYAAQAQLQHKLYKSLVSSLVVRGADYEASDQGSSGYTRRYGAGIVEDYTKRIGENNRLRISNSIFVDHTDQQAIGTIQNERHTFAEVAGDSFFLNFPNVLELTIQVFDLNRTQPGFVSGLDYLVIQVGPRTLIQRPAGSRIPAGAAVLVDYQTQPTPPGSYETLTESFQVRFELWKNLLGVYGRVDLSLNNAPKDLLVQNLTAYTFGADVTWRWLHAGAEYQIYDSDLSAYTATRLFQSLVFRPDEASFLSLDFSETWIDYTDLNRTEEDYRFMSRYHRALTHRLSLDAAAGIAIRRGLGVDETLATFRPSVRYVIGKTTIDATYDYEYQLFQNSQERQQHLFFVRLKRVF